MWLAKPCRLNVYRHTHKASRSLFNAMYFDLSRQDVSSQKHSRNGIRAIKRLNVILEAFWKIAKLINVKEESLLIHVSRTIIDLAFGIWTSATNTSLPQFVILDEPLYSLINKSIPFLLILLAARQSCELFLAWNYSISNRCAYWLSFRSPTLMWPYFIFPIILILSFASFKF